MVGTPRVGSPLTLYDDLVLEGRTPEVVPFCADFPRHGDLPARIQALERVRPSSRLPDRDAAAECDIGGFRLLRLLGEGGMGRVFLAAQVSSGRRAAVKVVGPDSPMSVERFRREAELAAMLSHPTIAEVYAFGLEARVAYLATELIHGFSVRDALAAAAGTRDPVAFTAETLELIGARSLSPPDCGLVPPLGAMVGLAIQVAEGLAHAHDRGVIHRDIKPSNIMFTLDGATKIIDFGLAIPVNDRGDRMTRPGAFLGSARYAAPEQLRGDHAAVGPWTDTFALGATLFELLTGESPFAHVSMAERRAAPEAAAPRTPRQLNPRVPPEVDRLVMSALHPAPAGRFQHGAALLQALRRA